MKFEPQYIDTNLNAPQRDHLQDFFRLSGLLMAIFFSLYLVLGYVAERLAQNLSPHMEEMMAAGFLERVPLNDFPATRRYVQGVLERLVAADKSLPPFKYKIYIVEDKIVNAVALPGGNLIVFTGLLEKIKNENELAMVLGHELGHYVHRDHLRGLGRGLVLVTLGSLIGISGDIPSFVMPSLQTYNFRFSRIQEGAADQFGVDIVQKTYGHVGGVLGVFDILNKEETGKVKTPGFFSTHPDTLSRKQSISDDIKKKRYLQAADVTPLPPPGQLPFKDDKGIEGAGKNETKNNETENNEYRVEGNRVNGKYEGPYKWYTKSTGKLHTQGEYHDGVEQGTFKRYYENGNLLCEWQYNKGEYEGLTTHYYEDGQVESRFYYLSGKSIGSYYSPEYLKRKTNKDQKFFLLRQASGEELFALVWLDGQGNVTSIQFYDLQEKSDGRHDYLLKTKEGGKPVNVVLFIEHGVVLQYWVRSDFKPAVADRLNPVVFTVVSDEGEEMTFTFHWNPDGHVGNIDLKPASLKPAYIIKRLRS